MKVITCGIYKITNPKGRIYIGQSRDILYRFSKYRLLTGGLKRQTLLYRSLLKYGHEKHRFEIIHVCDPMQLNELERYYIELFDTFNSKYGLNLTNGGDCYAVSKETRLKISAANKMRGKEWREKISASKMGNKNRLGKKLSPESIEKIRRNKIGKTASEETKRKMAESQRKRGKRSKGFCEKMSFINKGSKNWMKNPKFRGYKIILNANDTI